MTITISNRTYTVSDRIGRDKAPAGKVWLTPTYAEGHAPFQVDAGLVEGRGLSAYTDFKKSEEK